MIYILAARLILWVTQFIFIKCSLNKMMKRKWIWNRRHRNGKLEWVWGVTEEWKRSLYFDSILHSIRFIEWGWNDYNLHIFFSLLFSFSWHSINSWIFYRPWMSNPHSQKVVKTWVWVPNQMKEWTKQKSESERKKKSFFNIYNANFQ